jgi:N-acetylmuramoyl-L-alanine amidase
VLEKDLTLKIGTFLAEALTAEGATVILTRKTDVNPSLRERSAIANRNHADFFISIHINSNRLANSRSGSIAFHHGEEPIGSLLAECIQGEVAKAGGLPSLGPESDTSIYSSGFAVLRYAKMPAMLLECGFINDAHDLRRMVTDDFQRKIATAVVQGLKVYLGDAKTEEQ